jgi:hypothetical protein
MDESYQTLDRFLSEKIAGIEGISPEEVTVEYLHKQREERIYPYQLLWDEVSGLPCLLRSEIEEIVNNISGVATVSP